MTENLAKHWILAITIEAGGDLGFPAVKQDFLVLVVHLSYLYIQGIYIYQVSLPCLGCSGLSPIAFLYTSVSLSSVFLFKDIAATTLPSY